MNSARLAKMRCPNCDSVGTIDIDDVEAQMFCTDCCLVLEMNLGESDQTRWDGDEGLTEAKEQYREDAHTLDSTTKKGNQNTTTRLTGANVSKKDSSVFDFIQCLQRGTGATDPVAIGAVSLYSQYIDKLKATTSKANVGGDGGQNALAAAAFALTSARKSKTIPLDELARLTTKYTTSPNHTEAQWGKFILFKRGEIGRTLDLEAEIRLLDEAEFDSLSQQYHMLLGWPLVSYKAAGAFAKQLNRELSTVDNSASITTVQAVAVGLYMTRASAKLSALISAATPISSSSASATPPALSAVLGNICNATGNTPDDIKAILSQLQKNAEACKRLLQLAHDAVPPAIRQKRTREE